jgi:hypothetical protein
MQQAQEKGDNYGTSKYQFKRSRRRNCVNEGGMSTSKYIRGVRVFCDQPANRAKRGLSRGGEMMGGEKRSGAEEGNGTSIQ